MGRLLYGSEAYAIEIDDRVLAHLQTVIINKLRRGERFVLTLGPEESASHRVETIWLHGGMALRFEIAANAARDLNRQWLRAMARSAATQNGLRLVDEPPALEGERMPQQPTEEPAPAIAARTTEAPATRVTRTAHVSCTARGPASDGHGPRPRSREAER